MTTNLEGAELAAQRLKLFEDAVALRKPDRVPLMPLALEYFHTRMAGVSDRDAGYHAKLNFDSLREATVRLLALDNITWFSIEAENFESIHKHSAYAAIERSKV